MFVPPREVYEIPPQSPQERVIAKGYDLPDFIRAERSPGGEILAYFKGHPVPRKGMPWPEAVMTGNQIKKMLMLMLTIVEIRKGLTKFLESFLYGFCKLADEIYMGLERVPYLKKEYYNSTSKGVWDLSFFFFTELSVSVETANHFGKVIATILENDDAYRMPIVDIMSEFTKEEIIKDPRGFVKKAADIFEARSDNGEFKGKVQKFSRLIRFILLIPRFKKAFRKAFEKVDLSLLQYDEYDEYWALGRKGYDAKGIPFEHRFDQWQLMIKEYAVQQQQ